MKPLVLIVCPTIDGREDSFQRLYESYGEGTKDCNVDFIRVANRPTCGMGWNDGVSHGLQSGRKYDYIHLTCDDLEVMPGWDLPAMEAVDAGFQPAPYLDTFGEINYGHPPTPDMGDWKPTPVSVIPFMKAEWWEQHVAPMFLGHYYTDDYISARLRMANIPTVCRRDYSFKHHHEMHGRGAGMTQDERMMHDQRAYLKLLRGER